mmetsp:Transcript_74696/g.200053  ORF Transcript_74696/g.200053 Transcript_74696/m.200053 type:complete len:414 (-) Transcript_74696:696-1937(-)
MGAPQDAVLGPRLLDIGRLSALGRFGRDYGNQLSRRLRPPKDGPGFRAEGDAHRLTARRDAHETLVQGAARSDAERAFRIPEETDERVVEVSLKEVGDGLQHKPLQHRLEGKDLQLQLRPRAIERLDELGGEGSDVLGLAQLRALDKVSEHVVSDGSSRADGSGNLSVLAGNCLLERGGGDKLVGEAERVLPHALRPQQLHNTSHLHAVTPGNLVRGAKDLLEPQTDLALRAHPAEQRPVVEVSIVRHVELIALYGRGPPVGASSPHTNLAGIAEAVGVRLVGAGLARRREAGVPQEHAAMSRRAREKRGGHLAEIQSGEETVDEAVRHISSLEGDITRAVATSIRQKSNQAAGLPSAGCGGAGHLTEDVRNLNAKPVKSADHHHTKISAVEFGVDYVVRKHIRRQSPTSNHP